MTRLQCFNFCTQIYRRCHRDQSKFLERFCHRFVDTGEPVTGVYNTDGQLVALNWEYLHELYKNVKWRYRIIGAQDEDDSLNTLS